MIASLWVVVTKVSKENTAKASVGVAALPGASVCKQWQETREQRCLERATGRGRYTKSVKNWTHRKTKRRKLLRVFGKARPGL